MTDPFDTVTDVTGTDDDPFDTAENKPQRVIQGRYRLPDPDPKDPNPAYKRIKSHVGTDTATSWMRATRLASVIADSYALNMWRNRALLVGLVNQPSLLNRAAGLDIRNDRAELETIVEEGIRLADAVDRAAMGTRIHLATELGDRRIQATEEGSDPDAFDLPEPELVHHVVNWKASLLHIGIEIIAIEDIIAVAPLGVAGRLDRIGWTTQDVVVKIGQPGRRKGFVPREVVIPAGTYVIVDLKTGKSLELAWHEISVQLALYANHTHRYVEDGNSWGSVHVANPLQVDKRVALVVHIPAMEGGAYLYGVDIEKGWRGAQLARGVVDWHAETDFAGTAELL